MKVFIERKRLLDAAKDISKFAATKTSRDILKSMAITAKKDRLLLSATDMELMAEKTLECDIESDGTVIPPSAQFIKVLETIRDDFVTLESEGDPATGAPSLHIRGTRNDITLYGEKPRDFPAPETPDQSFNITVSAAMWYEMIHKTIFAASTDRGRFSMNGGFVRFDPKSKILTLVATDGKRLAIITRKVKSKGKTPNSIKEGLIVPTALFIKTQGTNKNGADEILHISYTEESSYISVHFDNSFVTARLIEGHYPNYKAVFPEKHKTSISIDVNILKQAIKECMLILNRDDRWITFKINGAGMLVQSSSRDYGKTEITLLPLIEGDEVTVKFNPDLLLDFLQCFKDGVVSVKFNDPRDVLLVTHEEDNACQYLLMPHK